MFISRYLYECSHEVLILVKQFAPIWRSGISSLNCIAVSNSI
ncbi:hypothetical protein Z949_3246 [Sulfitobacter guttiformis KCTC 32187]|nr:hypothetical protein Z949_3246 [Sulfitobacter guttiformis KCTC 32187]